MEPTALYEREGFFGNVVFSNGHVVQGDTILFYYGAADSVIAGARFSIRSIRLSAVLSAVAFLSAVPPILPFTNKRIRFEHFFRCTK